MDNQEKNPAAGGRTPTRDGAKNGTPRKAKHPMTGRSTTGSENAAAKAPPGKKPAGKRTAEAAARNEKETPVRGTAAPDMPPPARNAAGESGQPARKAPPKKKKRATGDAGYVPYQEAKERKKRQQKQQGFKGIFSSSKKTKNGKPVHYGTMADKPSDAEVKAARRAQAPAVVYTEPRAFSRNRFLVQLTTVFAVVIALVLGLSVFFRVKDITVTGAEVYSPWAVREASGINEGDNLLTFGRARAAGQIIANLPYVKNARIGIKLPDTVKIEIEEEDMVYSIQSEDDSWWLMNSDGKIVTQTNMVDANNYTKVLGVRLASPREGEIAVAVETVSLESAAGEEGTTVVTGLAKLDAAQYILKALEANDIVGEAASVDVSRLDDIVLWYGTRYQVNLGDQGNLDYKIACMVDAVLQMSDYQNGILDISFTTWTDQVGFTPFG